MSDNPRRTTPHERAAATGGTVTAQAGEGKAGEKRTRERPTADHELTAMSVITRELNKLPEDARRRVLSYFQCRYYHPSAFIIPDWRGKDAVQGQGPQTRLLQSEGKAEEAKAQGNG